MSKQNKKNNRNNRNNKKEFSRTIWHIASIVYVLIIIKLIIFKYPVSRLYHIMQSWGSESIRMGIESANFEPFKTIQMYIRYYGSLNSFENLFGNILVFIPFGFLIPHALPKMRNILWLLIFSGFFITDIELFQLVTRFGEFDVDDIILNVIGVVLGFMVFHIFYFLKRLIKKH